MSLSNTSNFSEEELDALGLWDVAEQFGKQRRSTLQVKKETTLTVDDIERVQKQAYDEAFSQGKSEGYKKGLQQGIEKGLQQGKDEGRVEGLKKGYDENKNLLQQQGAEFISLLESLSEPFKLLDDEVEKELLDLVIAIASQLIRREIKAEPGQIIAVIREAVNALPIASQKLTLHMHPEDAELVKVSLSLDEISSPWNIIEEPLISRGGCKVETETSLVDVTVENQLAVIIATILGDERAEDER